MKNRNLLPLIAIAGFLCWGLAPQRAEAQCHLRQSTASQIISLGTFVDSTDGVTPETGLTIANTDIKLQKAGGTTQTNKNSGGATHIATGDYYATLDATDTNTVGLLHITVKISGAAPWWRDCFVYEEAVYDALYAASAPGYVANAPVSVAQVGGTNVTATGGRMEVNLSHVGGTAVTATAGRPEVIVNAANNNAFEAADFSTDTFTAAKFATDAGTEFAAATWDLTTTGHTTSGTFGEQVKTDIDDILVDTSTTLDDLVDDLETRLGTPSNLGGGATVAGNLSDIEAQTDDIGAAGAGLTAADDAVLTRLGTPAGASVSADVAAVKSDSAAILDDTGTSGVLISSAVANCLDVLGCDVQGTLSGTHSTVQADLGTNAPANDITGYTLTVPSRNFSRTIATYNTGTGVATWTEATAVTLTNADQYYAWATAPPSASAGGSTDVETIEGVDATDQIDARIAAAGLAAASDLATLTTRVGTPSNLGGGATVAGNLSDIEAQTDDIGAAGAGLTAADDAVLTRLGTPAGASVSADIAAVEDQTDDIGAAGAGLTAADDSVMTRLGTPAGASVSADIAAVEDQTDELAAFITDVGTNGAGLTALPWPAAWDAEVQSEAADALTAIYLDQLFASTYNPATKPGAADALLNELVESDAGVARYTANALENAPSGGGGGSSDWTLGEKEQIRYRLGVDGDVNTPTATPNLATAAALQTVSGNVDDIESRVGTPTNLGGGATLAGNLSDIEGQTDDIGAAGAGLTAAGMTAAQLRTALGLGSANLDAQLAALGVDLDSVLADVASVELSIASLPEAVRDVAVDGSRTLGCALSALLAVEAGRAVTTDNDTTFYAPDGTTVRVVGTAPSQGNRTVTVTCPSN